MQSSFSLGFSRQRSRRLLIFNADDFRAENVRNLVSQNRRPSRPRSRNRLRSRRHARFFYWRSYRKSFQAQWKTNDVCFQFVRCHGFWLLFCRLETVNLFLGQGPINWWFYFCERWLPLASLRSAIRWPNFWRFEMAKKRDYLCFFCFIFRII